MNPALAQAPQMLDPVSWWIVLVVAVLASLPFIDLWKQTR